MAAKKTTSRKAETQKTTGKKAAGKAVAKKASSQQLAKFEEDLAAKAAEGLQREAPTTGTKISYQRGEFSMAGDVLGDTMEVVIFDECFVNEYYGGRPYDPDNPSSPVCFAIGDDETDLVPHDNSVSKQQQNCEDCDFNKFGSAEVGRGKECKNTRRLAVVSLDSVRAGGAPADAEIGLISLSPTSLKYFSSFKKKVAKTLRRPIDAVATELTLEKADTTGSVNYYLLKPEVIEPLTPEEYAYVQQVKEFNHADVRAPFPPAELEEAKPAAKKKASVKKDPSKKRKF